MYTTNTIYYTDTIHIRYTAVVCQLQTRPIKTSLCTIIVEEACFRKNHTYNFFGLVI